MKQGLIVRWLMKNFELYREPVDVSLDRPIALRPANVSPMSLVQLVEKHKQVVYLRY